MTIKDRSKNKPTPKQNKWNDPFFRKAVLSRIGHIPFVESLTDFLKKKGVKLPKGTKLS